MQDPLPPAPVPPPEPATDWLGLPWADWWARIYEFVHLNREDLQGFDSAIAIVGVLVGLVLLYIARPACRFALRGVRWAWGWGRRLSGHRPPPPLPSGARHQLDPVDPLFRGRDLELKALERQVNKDGDRIVGIFGLGGLGKSELARALAQRLIRRFPDAQIEIDLAGFSRDREPLTLEAIYAHVVHAFNERADTGRPVNELAATYRAFTRDVRGILFLDNARDAAQIERVLPPDCWLVIVTSRERFPLPGMHAPPLDPLSPKESEELLLDIAPHIGPLAGEIAERCGRLPFALRLAAGRVAFPDNPISPADYLRELETARGRLDLVEATLELSVNALPPDLRTQWCRLSVFPSDFDAAAVASVWGALDRDGTPQTDDFDAAVRAAAGDLARLHRASLVEYSPETRRYRLHDLVSDLCTDRCPADLRDEAAARHAQHYRVVLAAADRQYRHGHDGVVAGLAVADREWVNIQAGQTWAAAHAETDPAAGRLAIAFPLGGSNVLPLRLHPRQQIVWLDAAIAAARALGDRSSEGAALGNLGNCYAELGEPRRAIEQHEQALVIRREIGDRRGEGSVLGNLATCYAELGEPRRAIEQYEQALAIHREIGDRRGEGNDLTGLGNCYADLGEPRQAIELYERALMSLRAIGDRRGEGNDLGNMGSRYVELGEPRRAIELYEQALVIAREIGDRRGEGNALGNMATRYAELGEPRRAIELYEQALVIDREIGDRRGEGTDLFNLSLRYIAMGDLTAAVQAAEAALVIEEEIEDPHAPRTREHLDSLRARLGGGGPPAS